MKKILVLALAFLPLCAFGQTVPKMVDIPGGTFIMGNSGEGYNYDEAPAHKVTLSAFRISACEITNAQFEEFFPDHKELRGKEFGISTGDNEAVCYVSWHDAYDYCNWLSAKTGRKFRLPTEAEWEYACRAWTNTPYYTGDVLPEGCDRNQKTERNLKLVSLEVGKSQPNAWGLYDMHGNVEEWCLDYYGPYSPEPAVNPVGPEYGDFKVTRGGSHNTPAEFLRSANRSAASASDSHSQIGFRIVEELPYEWKAPSEEPLFAEPVPYVIAPTNGSPFYRHNHQPAVTWCDDGDLLAIWFSCDAENGREMVVLGSRFHDGKWAPASLFYKVPDRNMTGSSLVRERDGIIVHYNGVGNSGDWQNLSVIRRYSFDNGRSWSYTSKLTEHGKRHQVIAGGIMLKDGTTVQPCDAGPEGNDGTAVLIVKGGFDDCFFDRNDPWDGKPLPVIPGTNQIADGTVSSTIGGIHAGLVELADSSWMALGRGNPVPGVDGKLHMPMSVSKDRGRSWLITASEFPPIDGGQRLVLRRLNEGPILLVSFTDHPERSAEKGMDFNGEKGYGVFVAVSYDEGKTWPVRRLLTDGVQRTLDGGAWTGEFTMDATHSEPKGYFAATQTPDGVIHILSSRLHYRINLPWIEAFNILSSRRF